ncbi:alpha-2-macroglobulin-like isoform X4 [Varroa jacobsoni]|uniref:alpha-2-macroglobulin-like isoform X4 n=1 Tax=Varroa jacobsoni TaxID=62625 RepID=UPI000BF65318|nr:alpha-2-macroglobulin-like isoform X4 [Varroa jacobsoni]
MDMHGGPPALLRGGLLLSVAVALTLAQCNGCVSFICLLPKVMYEGDKNMFILDVENQDQDGNVTIKVVDQDNSSVVHYTKDYELKKADGHLFQLDVSDIKIARTEKTHYVKTYRVMLDAKFGETKVSRNTTIRIHPPDLLLLVQTDKKIYKPGQRVYIRAMPLDYNLRPRKDGNVTVSVADPLNNVVAIWKDVPLMNMVVQFDFQITDEPPIGTWYINVKYDGTRSSLQADTRASATNEPPEDQFVYNSESELVTSTFVVSEYTLPKFEVRIIPPPFVLMDASSVSFKICANYTFGKPVIGKLKVNTTLTRYHWEIQPVPINFVQGKINGCYDLTIDTSTLNLTNSIYEFRKIQVLANVFEDKTQEQRNSTSTISRTNQPLKLTFQPNTNGKYFRPFMNTYGQLKVTNPDDTPAPNEPVELCLTAKSEVYEFHHQRTDNRLMCKNYTSDTQGMINFVLPPHRPSVVSFGIEAVALNYPTKKYPGNDYSILINQPRASTFYRAFFSTSERYLQFEPIAAESQPCDAPVNLSAYYTFEDGDENIQFKYVVLARARNIVSKTITVQKPQELTAKLNETELLTEDYPQIWSDVAKTNDKQIGRIDFEVDPESSQLPQLTVLLYYIHNGTEVIADSIKVIRDVCPSNKVELSFSETVIQPGGFVNLMLSASPKSQCGYEVVDRSVKLLSGNEPNPFYKYRNALPNREISQWEYPQADNYRHCIQNGGQSDYVDVESVMLNPGWTLIEYNIKLSIRPCRSTRDGTPVPELNQLTRALTIAQSAGGAASGPRTFSSRLGLSRQPPLRPALPLAVPQAALSTPLTLDDIADISFTIATPSASRIGNDFGVDSATASQSVVDIRNYFPELWLFQLNAIDNTGKLAKNLTAPHQVTTWNADAMCIHLADGLGVAETKEVKTYQAFFTEVKLPYSVKRGEKLPIIISTFNYLPHCMPVSIDIDPLPGLEVDDKTSLSKEACICPDSSPFHYELRVKVTDQALIGDLNVTVTTINSESMSVCEGKQALSVASRDKITRPLKIIPEGFMQEVSESRMLCPEKEKSVETTFKLEVPDNAVKGSARSLFSVSGDMMGQAASNLDHLIILPTGCGEQNMAKLMSNLAVNDYLRASKQLEPKLENKILHNLKTGYQNQLKYRGRDGSYSVWGGHWGQASTFLTAMVYGGLRDAKQYIFIDDAGQETTLKYLIDTQNTTTGCFNRIGSIYSWALRRSESSDDTRGSYTAYVMAVLRDAITDKRRIMKGLLCIQAQKNMDAYALALSAYAAALYEDNELATKYLSDLKAFENTKFPNQKFYARDDTCSSNAVETAAYSVLAQLELHKDSPDAALQEVQPIVRWLMKKQNRNGGFTSSQDTVIGLKAMSKFAALTYGKQAGIHFDLIAKGVDFDEKYKITKDNAIVWDTRLIKTVPNDLAVEGTGLGCVVVTSQIRYNLPKIPSEAGFDFNITVAPGSTVEHTSLELCISYEGVGGQPSSMAIVQLELLSGYNADKSSLQALINSGKARLFDIENGHVIIYFQEFTSTPNCSIIQLERVFDVENLKPATAKVYDYYDTDKQKSIEYTRGDLQSDLDNI